MLLSSAQLLDGATFWSFFQNCEQEAFRFESLPVYTVEAEREGFLRFQQNLSFVPTSDDKDWTDYLDLLKKTGRQMRRVRLAPSPVTDYYRFEALCYYERHIQDHAADIRLISEAKLMPILQTLPFNFDFWMFDRSVLVAMIYDKDGRFLGAAKLASDQAQIFAAAIPCLLDNSTPMDHSYFEALRHNV